MGPVLGLAFAARPGRRPPPVSRRLTTAQRLDDGAPEDAALAALIEAARFGGWLVSHNRDSRSHQSDPGVPDLVCAHPRRGVVFIEAKTRAGWAGLVTTRPSWAAGSRTLNEVAAVSVALGARYDGPLNVVSDGWIPVRGMSGRAARCFMLGDAVVWGVRLVGVWQPRRASLCVRG